MNFTTNNKVVNGKEIAVVAGIANTGNPQYNSYTPGYLTTSGAGEVPAKVTTTLFFKDSEGKTLRFRTNFWGEAAEDAKVALVDSNRVAQILVEEARISYYTDKFGEERLSLNINFRGQYKVRTLEEHVGDSGFTAALAKAYDDAPF